MSLSPIKTKRILRRKLVTAVLVSASVAAFATLGDGGKKGLKNASSVLMPYTAKSFSLRSNYNYRSNSLYNQPEKKNFITLTSMVTYQKGNAAYVLPLKKLPLMGKIKFSPAH